MERKRYIPPDPREYIKADPLPTPEQFAEMVVKKLGLPPVRIDGNKILTEEGEIIAVKGIDPKTGKRTLTLCGKGREEAYTVYWPD